MSRCADLRAVLAGLLALYLYIGVATALAADETDSKWTATAATEEQPAEEKNWIELGFGGVIVNGDRAQFEQEHRLPGDQVFGGIQDLHYERAIGSDAQLVLDGHAIFDTNDYKLQLTLSKQELGYIQFGY